MGDLDSPLLVIGAVGIVGAVAWARVVTGHHTLWQVSLGMIVSFISVVTAFGLILLSQRC